jgi:hypothetical protein
MTRPADVVSAVAPAPDALSVLRKARALIEKPEHWTQGAYARDALGEKCPDGDERAHSFCAIGAMWRVVPSSLSVTDAANALCRAAGIKTSIDAFNDSHTHAEVLAAFDKAIASLESA